MPSSTLHWARPSTTFTRPPPSRQAEPRVCLLAGRQGGSDCSGLGDVPGVVQKAVALDITGRRVLSKRVKGAAFIGELLVAVVTGDHRPVARRRGVAGRERWPVGCA